MGSKRRTCAVPTCDAPIFDKYDRYYVKHIPISPNERVRDFDITEKTSMECLISDMRSITRYTWYMQPSASAISVAENSLRIADEWRVVCYDAIGRLAVIVHYVYAAKGALEASSMLPEPPDHKPLVETRASLMYMMEHCQIHAARFADISKGLTPVHFLKRRMYLQAADVWWKSRLKIDALRETLGWLEFSLKRFDASVRAAKESPTSLSRSAREVLSMDAEVLGGLGEALFKTVLLHYQELITL
jgi:hypothetical protein